MPRVGLLRAEASIVCPRDSCECSTVVLLSLNVVHPLERIGWLIRRPISKNDEFIELRSHLGAKPGLRLRSLLNRMFVLCTALVHESELARNEPDSQVHHLPRAYDDGLPSSAIRLRM